jgi:hypothetical protein
MKRLLPVIMIIALVLLGGCSIDFGSENIDLPTSLYTNDNGYELMVPDDWLKVEETVEQVSFAASDNQLAFSITTELGGIDYYSMRELKEQYIEEIGEELFKNYDIADDANGTKYFYALLEGADKNGSKITANIYAYQPYLTIRHYLVVIASGSVYKQYSQAIEQLAESFTITISEDDYLQLMIDRREAALEESDVQNDAADGQEGADGEIAE